MEKVKKELELEIILLERKLFKEKSEGNLEVCKEVYKMNVDLSELPIYIGRNKSKNNEVVIVKGKSGLEISTKYSDIAMREINIDRQPEIYCLKMSVINLSSFERDGRYLLRFEKDFESKGKITIRDNNNSAELNSNKNYHSFDLKPNKEYYVKLTENTLLLVRVKEKN
ncbi:MAG: hypothetical protein QXT34_03305 [Candidatus Aenigmatarchaeota archaeon]